MNARRVRLLDSEVYRSKDPLDKTVTYIAMVCDDINSNVEYIVMVQSGHYEDKFAKGHPEIQEVDYEIRIYLVTNELQSNLARQLNLDEFTVYYGDNRESYMNYGYSTLSRWMTLVEVSL